MVISKNILMIELSKCPQCAPDDQVVIAGKEFCMRCGTPAEDNSLMESASAAATSASSSADSLQSPAVAKFNTAPPAIIPIQPMGTDLTPAPATPAPAIPAPVTPAPVAPAPATPAPATPAPATPAPVLESTGSSVAELDKTISELSATPTIATINPELPQDAQSTLPNTAVTLDPINTAVPPGVVTPEAPVMPAAQVSQPLPPATDAPSTAMQNPTNQQLNASDIYLSVDAQVPAPLLATQPLATPPLPATNLPASTLPQEPMQLSEQSGVLSDAQFDELQNSLAPAPPPVDSLAAVSSPAPVAPPEPTEAISPQPVAAPQQSNDIYSSPIAPSNLAVNSAAIEQVSAGLPDASNKTSSIKKVLKPASVAVSIVTLFMVGAYIWKVNYPNLAFKIASAKAGIVATVPGYMPSGFDLGGEIQTNPGSISYSLQSSQSGKKILISQSKTDWDSQALAENYVAPKAENYLALQAQGLTVYILGKNQATWVNHGTWYKIESSDSSLDQDQIIRMATSL